MNIWGNEKRINLLRKKILRAERNGDIGIIKLKRLKKMHENIIKKIKEQRRKKK